VSTETLVKSLTEEAKLVSSLNKRSQQVNKEHKATMDRFKELTEKLSKKYGTLAN